MAGRNELEKLADLRTLLEKRVKDMESELDGLRVLLDFVNNSLIEKSFKRVELAKTAPAPAEGNIVPSVRLTAEVAPPQVSEHEPAIPIKTATGELLANLYLDENSIRVVIAEDRLFTVDIPPFMAFLVDRVLVKMQEKDREAAETGEIAPDKILNYSIISEGDFLREITIRNIDSDRARELKSTIRWTLEKMYEKVKSSS